MVTQSPNFWRLARGRQHRRGGHVTSLNSLVPFSIHSFMDVMDVKNMDGAQNPNLGEGDKPTERKRVRCIRGERPYCLGRCLGL